MIESDLERAVRIQAWTLACGIFACGALFGAAVVAVGYWIKQACLCAPI